MERMRIAVFLCALAFATDALAAEPLSGGTQAGSIAPTKVFVFDLNNTNPQEVQEILQKLFPGVNHGRISAIGNIISSSTDKAEAINAQAMRDFQKRWEIHLKNPAGTLPPVLYPAKSQQILESPRSESPASTAVTKQLGRKNPS
jgi:hypothetical protein